MSSGEDEADEDGHVGGPADDAAMDEASEELRRLLRDYGEERSGLPGPPAAGPTDNLSPSDRAGLDHLDSPDFA